MVDLKCISARFSIAIAIPERWTIKKAHISFKYVNSSNLLADKSQLVIKLNEFPLAQVKLNPLAPEGEAKVSIPALLLEPGYHELIFNVFQHYSMECEDPCAEDLWTTLKLDGSFLEIEYDLKPVPLKLSTISNFLFDPKMYPHGEVNLVTEDFSSEVVTIASVVASGIARRFDYKKVLFSISEDIKPGYDNILIGRKEFVENFLGQRGIEIDAKKIIGPFLKIMQLPAGKVEKDDEETSIYMRTIGNVVNVMAKPLLNADIVAKLDEGSVVKKMNQEGDWIYADFGKDIKGWIHSDMLIYQDPFHALIVVSGENLDHVKLASETMAIMSLPYPDTDELIAMEFTVPEIVLYGGRLIIAPEKKYDFKTLNFETTSFTGINPMPKDITFRLPVGFLIKQNKYANLALSFAYGAGMRAGSALNISLNDKYIRGIHLDNPRGDIIEGYQLTIPTHLFRPGTNTLKFKPVMTPSASNKCEYLQTENLFLTIFENSTLYFPKMSHFVKLPKIELFILNGFPFTRWPDAHEAMIYITKSDSNTIASALNLVGLMTQKNGYPLLGLKVSFNDPQNWEGELIVIGEVSTIPKHLKEVTPIKLTRTTVVPYPVIRSWKGEMSLAFSKQIIGSGSVRGFMMEFQSPFKEGRTILLITAHSAKDLLVFSEALLEPAVQAKAKGDVVMVDLVPPDYRVTALDVGKKYFTGKSGNISKLDFYLQFMVDLIPPDYRVTVLDIWEKHFTGISDNIISKLDFYFEAYPFIYLSVLGFIVLFVALTGIYFLMRRRKKRRLGATVAGD